MTREEVIEYFKSLVEVRRKYGDMLTMKDEIECLDMGVKELTAISELSKSLKAVNRYDMDEKVLIGFNMAVAIFNECFGEICALKNEQPEQNVGMCQQNVGEMSEKQTDGDLISRKAVLDRWEELSVRGRTEFDQAVMMLPSAEKTAEWIPVSERLPEVMDGTNGECSDDVLICVADDEQITISTGFYGYYPKSKSLQGWWSMWTYGCHQIDSKYKVIAWMPLPGPYKVE